MSSSPWIDDVAGTYGFMVKRKSIILLSPIVSRARDFRVASRRFYARMLRLEVLLRITVSPQPELTTACEVLVER